MPHTSHAPHVSHIPESSLRASEKRNRPDVTRNAENIASAAARLMAENGLTDFNAAKRKALRLLGLPANTPLPENARVEAGLRLYQRLFQESEHAERLTALREKAREMLARLQGFNPYLTGPTLDGSAGRSAEIDIQLFTDSAKDVEIFLLNAHLDFTHRAPRTDRAEAVLSFTSGGVTVNLIVYPRPLERVAFKTRDGRVKPRIRLDALERLIQREADSQPNRFKEEER